MREVVDAVRAVSGRDFKVTETGRRPGDPASLVADAGLARTLLGWRAQGSGLDRIVADAWAYAQAHL